MWHSTTDPRTPKNQSQRLWWGAVTPNLQILATNSLYDKFVNTVKPVCDDHMYDKIYYLWFIQ